MEVMKVRNIAKSFGGLAVLQDVSFDLRRAKRLPLLARTAPGKLLSSISSAGCLGLLPAASHFLGHDLTKLTPNGRVALGLSRSFQVSSLFPGLSVFENMLMALFGLQRSRYQMSVRLWATRRTTPGRRSSWKDADLWLAKDTPVQRAGPW